MNKVKSFKESPPKERILTGEEEKALLDASPKHLRHILITALNTGYEVQRTSKSHMG